MIFRRRVCFHQWKLQDVYLHVGTGIFDQDTYERFIVVCVTCQKKRDLGKDSYVFLMNQIGGPDE